MLCADRRADLESVDCGFDDEYAYIGSNSDHQCSSPPRLAVDLETVSRPALDDNSVLLDAQFRRNSEVQKSDLSAYHLRSKTPRDEGIIFPFCKKWSNPSRMVLNWIEIFFIALGLVGSETM